MRRQNHVHAVSHQSARDIAEYQGLSHIPNQMSGSGQVNSHSALPNVPYSCHIADMNMAHSGDQSGEKGPFDRVQLRRRRDRAAANFAAHSFLAQ